MSESDRADRMLVKRGHYASRSAAQAAISAGLVRVNGAVIRKASHPIGMADRIEAEMVHPWVSRGGMKLAHALDVFGIDPSGRVCLDVGASTGGFTDVLLSRGARKVYAVDVGHGQLHEKLAGDRRVLCLEGTDARTLSAGVLAPAPDLIVCDASFIALEKLLAVPLSLSAPEAGLVCLFKPQFQVGRAYVGKGGLVTDKAAVQRAEEAFCDWLVGENWRVQSRTDSPITGGDGNAERLVWAKKA